MSDIRAICFDAFGTLVEITDKRQPFRALLRGGVKGITVEEVLTKPLSLREVAAGVSHELGEGDLAKLETDLQAECASIRLRPGIAEIWQNLRKRGLRIGVCSNLALPYGSPLLATLPDTPDAAILSCEVGLAKPDPAIFRLVCDRLELQPAEILFVGDTPSADVDGPRAIGMPAILIADFEAYLDRQVYAVGDLPEDIVALIEAAVEAAESEDHEDGAAVEAELARAFAAPEASYRPLTADEVIGRNSQQAPSDSPAMPATFIRGSGLGRLVSLEEGEALLAKITVDDDSTDWAASELLSATDLAERLQVPLATLDTWRDANRAIAFRNDDGEYIYPVRQFDGSEPVEGLDRVVAFFTSPDEVWEWLVTPHKYTNDEAPIDRLRSKHTDEVVRAAEGENDFH
ncbi:HAD-IA family hydrolase (plasmid) [Microvirga terrae]|uniref:HAD-IA family hydrolase n=1 Tax=Microvirga terrae TaxID=2740529 RepID=A0ABY5RZ16_9HYPH|nr:HAD-IA family hydrolase [Microvirga terrae]UVF22496.1 HAD-IA family hydrolase [Microvirga terrae]